ncbi:MAG: universal stress protein, partial [Thermoanaerobaculia bacterium]|nr:universal stress protein [Thermoanaerobaculia bacterium]
MKIQTVLCPVDFSSLSDTELRLATEVCETFGARLVLHHNLAAAAPGMSKAWEWEGAHLAEGISEIEAEKRMAELLARIPQGIATEARISRGPVALLLLYLVEELNADLLVLGSHGWSSEEHASVAERLLERCPCPVMTVQEGKGEGSTFRLRQSNLGQPVRAVVATDLSEPSRHAVTYAFELARQLPLELHLLNVAAARSVAPMATMGYARPEPTEYAVDLVETQLKELVPADFEGKVQVHVEIGRAAEGILRSLQSLDPEFWSWVSTPRAFCATSSPMTPPARCCTAPAARCGSSRRARRREDRRRACARRAL